MAKSKRKTKLVGVLSPGKLPAVGTRYLLDDQKPVEVVATGEAGSENAIQIREDDYPDKAIWISLGTWNKSYAPHVVEVRPPLISAEPQPPAAVVQDKPTGLSAYALERVARTDAAFALLDKLIEAADPKAVEAILAGCAAADRPALQLALDRGTRDGWASTPLNGGGLILGDKIVAADGTSRPIVRKADLIRERIRDLAPPPKVEPLGMMSLPLSAVVEVHNDRLGYDEAQMAELMESMRRLGQLQPVAVRDASGEVAGKGKAAGPRYELVYGHRRTEAARRLGWSEIQAIVYPAAMDGQNPAGPQVAARRLAENLARADLTHVEIANILREARDQDKMTTREIARQIGKSMDFVQKHLLLAALCPPVQQLVAAGTLPVKHAEKLSAVGSQTQQIKIAGDMTHRQWKAEAGAWEVSDPGYNADPVAWANSIEPYSKLMERLSWAVKGIAGGGWPVDVEYAGKPPCQGCPSCSETYTADDPQFWSGLKPQSSGSKGYCTDEACYAVKRKLAEKEKAARAKKREEDLALRIAANKELGFAVCDRCGKQVAEAKDLTAVGKQKLCDKCAKREAKRRDPYGSDEYDTRRRAARRKQKAFPETPPERLAVGLHQYAAALAAALVKHVAAGHAGDAERIALHLALCEPYAYMHAEGAAAKLTAAVPLGKPLPAKVIAGLIQDALEQGFPADAPHVNWLGDVENVPLPPRAIARIERLEAAAAYWKLDLAKLKIARPAVAAVDRAEPPAAVEKKPAKKASKTAAKGGRGK